MTSDGIENADWNLIHDLAVDIVNCSSARDEVAEARARTSLFLVLDELNSKYGPKPSLLATRADYVDSSDRRERLLRDAYDEAKRIADDRNQALIAHSLAEFYIEEVQDLDRGAMWLGVWRDRLGLAPAGFDQEEVSRLEGLLLLCSRELAAVLTPRWSQSYAGVVTRMRTGPPTEFVAHTFTRYGPFSVVVVTIVWMPGPEVNVPFNCVAKSGA